MLVIGNHLILIISKMAFKYYVKEILLGLMETLVHQRKCSINFSKAKTVFCLQVCVTMVIIDICLLMEKKSISLKLVIKMLTFQVNFV